MKNATLIKAEFVRVGDRVIYNNPQCNFTVQNITENDRGFQFHFNHYAKTNFFGRSELVWIERQ